MSERIEPFIATPPKAVAPKPRVRVPVKLRPVETYPGAQMKDRYAPYKPPAGVVGSPVMGMDSGFMTPSPSPILAAAFGSSPALQGYYADGLGFHPYPLLAQMMERAEFRKPVEVIAEECVREWIRFKVRRSPDSAEDNERAADLVRQIENEFKRLKAKEVIYRLVRDGLGYGLSFIWPDVGDPQTSESQSVPLTLDSHGVKKGSLRAIVNIEPLWTTPNAYNSTNPFDKNFYKPERWWVLGTLTHHTRLHAYVPFPVGQMLKPAFNFGGLSLTQQTKAYVHNFLRTRENVSALVGNFATRVLKTTLAGSEQTASVGDPYGAALGGGDLDADSLAMRVSAFNQMASNHGTFVLDKETEEYDIKATPLSGLSDLQSQSMEAMASIPGVPLVKMFGLQPSGLNASSDGEIRVFYDYIASRQERDLRPAVDMIFKLAQLNLWGKIEEDLEFEFVHLWQMDEKQAAEVEKLKADTDAVNIAANKISTEEARAREATDDQSIYRGIDLTGDPPPLPDPMMLEDIKDVSDKGEGQETV